MKIWVQPGGDDRRVPMESSTIAKPRWFQHGVPTLVEQTRYVDERLRDGDLVKVQPPAEQPAAAEAPQGPGQSEPPTIDAQPSAATQKLAAAVQASAARAAADKKAE